jgi:hypothetical protein
VPWEAKEMHTPSPPPPQKRSMLLIINDKLRNNAYHPTMSMIVRGLFASLCRAIYYFQYDSLWRIMKIVSNTRRSHDVYDQKCFSLKMGIVVVMFSIGYSRQHEAS